MKDIVSAQRRYFNANHTKPLDFRIAQLEKLRAVLRSNEPALEAAIHRDYGKRPFETFLSEFFLVYDEIEVAIANLGTWAAPSQVDTNALNQPATSYVLPEPLGSSLIIGPWNYPYQLSLAPAIAAIAAGCTVLLKPSELTAHCSALLAELIGQTFAPDFFAVVEGGVAETTALLAEKFDIIFFTGSVPVGKIVYQAAARHLTPVVLELGGKSPTIIAPDCNLAIAAKRLVWAKFLNAGQTCIAPDYVCVHRSVYLAFLNCVVEEVERAAYDVDAGNYVRIVNERNTERVASLIEPAKVILGGRYDIAARTIEPTVMRDVSWADKVMQEEIFGPLLPFLPYDDLDALIANIKDRPKPLSLYLFTEDAAVKQKVLAEISFGGGCINDAIMHIANGELPFGGVGDSGIGSYHGEAGFRAFSHYKSVLDRAVVEDPEVKFPPYTDEKLALLKAVVGLGG
ncbi:aldehyde dehydrogenase (NAD+) [Duganella sp. CF517]|uniref:aldehyde dehydrogenase family protein n=1 Tax=Duganella sp. CF517 TaxID=1881038 RepID=UPI0008B14A5B|nr:aldehyde dehydrogenase family protein [Duganella sp. CF517]SEN50065.1 aldehyde dehydrogenase (NAD+) [Duganella sp. CF517]